MIRFLLLVSAVFVVVLAAPAGAHEGDPFARDPFVPLISEGDASAGSTTEGGGIVADDPVIPAPDAERLAATGVRAGELVGLALALMGMGVATVVAVNARRPRKIPQRAEAVL